MTKKETEKPIVVIKKVATEPKVKLPDLDTQIATMASLARTRGEAQVAVRGDKTLTVFQDGAYTLK